MVPPLTNITRLTTFLIDLDGVIYRGEEIVPGAREFVQWLQTKRKKFLFLTNNSFASEAQVVKKLNRLGIEVDGSHVLGAGQAAVQSIAHRFPNASVYIVGETPLFEMVRAHGLNIANESKQQPDIVLVGLDRHFTYQRLNEAVLAVKDGAQFIAINRDSLLPLANGSVSAGCGTMVAAIEAGSNISPEVIGKPHPQLLQEAMRLLESQPDETIMIGDNLESDIRAGIAAHTQTLFVLSGKDTLATLEKSGLKPTYISESLKTVMQTING